MSGFPLHDSSAGPEPRSSTTDPALAASRVPSGPDMPAWPEFQSHPPAAPPLFHGFRTVTHPPALNFGRPPTYHQPAPAHSTLFDHPTMSGHQSSFPYPDSYRPPTYRQSVQFGAPSPHPPLDDGVSPPRVSQYALPSFAPPQPYHHGFDDLFQFPHILPSDRPRANGDPYTQDRDLLRSPFAHSPGRMEPFGRAYDPPSYIANGIPREQLQSARQSPWAHTGFFGSPNDNNADSTARTLGQQDLSARPRRSSLSPDRTPHSTPVLTGPRGFAEEGFRGLRGHSLGQPPFAYSGESPRGPRRDRPSGSDERERIMRRQRELARFRNSSSEHSSPSEASDNDAMRARRHQRLFGSSSRSYSPPSVSEAQIAKFKSGLKRMVHTDLPEGASSVCVICDKDYSKEDVTPCEEAEIAIELPCKHVFGEDCLNTWINTCKTHKHKVTCPMCRKILLEPPVRRPRPMGGWYRAAFARTNSDSSTDPAASSLLGGLDDELRTVLPASAFEHFRAALAARGDTPLGSAALTVILRDAIHAGASVGEPPSTREGDLA